MKSPTRFVKIRGIGLLKRGEKLANFFFRNLRNPYVLLSVLAKIQNALTSRVLNIFYAVFLISSIRFFFL